MQHEYYDALETRSEDAREADVMTRLSGALKAARAGSAHYRKALADVDPSSEMTRSSLAALPVTRKDELLELQQREPPFGGLPARELKEFRRVFSSPGPIFEPERLGPDPWRMARALFAAGVRAGDLVHNTFSYHFTPAGSMVETAAHALGCPVFAAGVGQTEQQVEAIARLKPSAYVGTPSFLKIILDRASEMERDVASLKKALVSGEALPESLRQLFADVGIDVAQCYAIADLGLIAYESSAREGLIVDEGAIVEIVTPGTGDPVSEGAVGEVLVTTLDHDYPLIRFATGDLSAMLPGASPCGRTAPRIKGWMGRADQTTKVRGMFVRPTMVADVARRHPEVRRARLVVSSEDHQDQLRIECEAASSSGIDKEAIAASVRDVTKLRADVTLVDEGSLPNDGLVIVDERSYD